MAIIAFGEGPAAGMSDTTKSGFSADERAAMRQRAKELKAQESAAEALQAVVDKIASLDEPDQTTAARIHAIVREVAPALQPRLFYGSPAYANFEAVTRSYSV